MSRIRELILPFQPGVLVAAMLMVTACGTSSGDRAVSGGGIGAAAGAVIGAITGLTVLEGALIGTGLGAAIGGFTDADTVNLGEPIWKRYSTSPRTQTSGAPQTSNMVAATQANLTQLGYRPGPVDGLYGPQTGAAIRQYQSDYGLPDDGELSGPVALKIENRAAGF